MRALLAASALAALCTAQDDDRTLEIEITGGGVGRSGDSAVDSATNIYSRLLDAVRVDAVTGESAVSATATLAGLAGSGMTMTKEEEDAFNAGVDIFSESGTKVTAVEGFEVTSGGKFDVQVQESLDLTAGAMDVKALGGVSVTGGDDAEISIDGDIGAMVSGTVSVDADAMSAMLAGAASIMAGGEMKVEAGGDASLAAQSLLANVAGDIGVLGRGIHMEGTEELSVVVGKVDVRSPGAVHLAGKGGLIEMGSEPIVEFISFAWRSNDKFDNFENFLPDPVADVTEILVRAISPYGADVSAGAQASVKLSIGESDGAGGTTFSTVWRAANGGGQYSMDGLSLKLNRLYSVTAIRLGSTGGSGGTFDGWSQVEFLLGQEVTVGVSVVSASGLEATAVGGVLLGADSVLVSAASDVSVDALKTSLTSADVSVKATGKLSAGAQKVELDVAETLDVFTGGELSGSFGAVGAEVRGDASLTAAGAVDLAGESASLVLSGKLDASVGDSTLRTDSAILTTQTLSAVASDGASLHTADASLSASGRVDAYINTADVTAQGDLSVSTRGDVSGIVRDLSMESETTTVHTGQMDAAVGNLNLDANDMEIASDTAIAVTAGGDASVSVGDDFTIGVAETASMVAGSLEIHSMNKAGIVAGDDVEVLTDGDIGATASGKASLDADKLTATVAGATTLTTGSDISLSAAGDATLAAGSLLASTKGDVGVLGENFQLSGTKELNLIAGEIDVQTPGAIHLTGKGATVAIDGDGMEVASAATLDASAAGVVRLNAGEGVSLSSSADLDVNAESTSLLSKDVTVAAEREMVAKATTMSLDATDTLTAFAGGEVSGSFGSVSTESRGGAGLVAAGAVDLTAQSASVTLSGSLDATASDMKLRTDAAELVSQQLTATAMDSASLYTQDATLSMSGQLDAFMHSGSIMADGDIAVASAGDLSARARGIELQSDGQARVTAGRMDALVGNLKFHAHRKDSDATRTVKMPLNCGNLPGGCDSISDADSPAMLAELAELLGVDASRLNVRIKDTAGGAAGRRRLQSAPKPPPEWTTDELTLWLGEEMGMKTVAGAAKREEVDGAMAVEMIREDWLELGASGLKASRIVSGIRRLVKEL